MLDPMSVSIELSGVDTNVPVLPEGDVQLQVVESMIEANKDKTGNNWRLKLATINPATAVDGRELKPNFPVFHTCALQAREDSTDPEAFKRSLCESVDAIFATDKTNRPALTKALIDSAVGRIVIGHVYPDEYPKDSGKFSTKVRRLKKSA